MVLDRPGQDLDADGLVLILTGGRSQRMGRPKALLPTSDEPNAPTFLQQIAHRTSGLGVRQGVVSSLPREHLGVELPAVTQTKPEEGQLSSLLLGWKTWGERAPWVLVCLVDHPFVEQGTYGQLLQARSENEEALVWSLSYRGRGGHPALFSREFLRRLEGAPVEQGARPLVQALGPLRSWVETDDPAIRWDVDTPEQYQRFLAMDRQRRS